MDEIARVIDQFRRDGLPVAATGPAPEAAVRELEAAFGREMPPSYRAFLLRFGSLHIPAVPGRNIPDQRISGVTDGLIDGAVGRAWYDTQLARSYWEMPADVLVIETGYAPMACLDFGRRRLDGECPVARFDPATGVDTVTDPSFAVWLPVWLHGAACDREP
ncbi:MAG: SMI1/KNR4 family protein [Gemmataceae bacterium]